MRRAIRTHARDLVAIIVLVALAVAVIAYILEHQPAFMFGRSYYQVKAAFSTASAVTPGQGQSVTIAGVQVGLVGGVTLEHGDAVVTMDILRKYAPIYRDATVLLRPRTPLKDMYLALDPGDAGAGRIPPTAARSGWPALKPPSTSTRSSTRSTPTRATTCCCCSPAVPRRSTARVPRLGAECRDRGDAGGRLQTLRGGRQGGAELHQAALAALGQPQPRGSRAQPRRRLAGRGR